MGRLMFYLKLLVALIIVLSQGVLARIHKLTITNDNRGYFSISNFGFYRSGYLKVIVDKLKITPEDAEKKIGFSLEKTNNPYTDKRPDQCLLSNFQPNDTLVQHVFFIFDLKNKQVYLNCSEDMTYLYVAESRNLIHDLVIQQHPEKLADSHLFPPHNKPKREVHPVDEGDGEQHISKPTAKAATGDTYKRRCNDVKINMTVDSNNLYSFKFLVYVAQEKEEGLYSLNFHNCMNYPKSAIGSTVDMFLQIEERNPDDNYLSAGQMPLPALHFMMALLFFLSACFLSACFWFFLLKKSKFVLDVVKNDPNHNQAKPQPGRITIKQKLEGKDKDKIKLQYKQNIQNM